MSTYAKTTVSQSNLCAQFDSFEWFFWERGRRHDHKHGTGDQKIQISIAIDPQTISNNSSIYSESTSDHGQLTASVDFCVRFLTLHTPGVVNNIKVNFIETSVKLNVDLTDGFEVEAIYAKPFKRCKKVADKAFEVEGYICFEGYKTGLDGDVPTMKQGDKIKVYVRPISEA
jgi:hypothetical protein